MSDQQPQQQDLAKSGSPAGTPDAPGVINPEIEAALERAIIRCGDLGAGEANPQNIKDLGQASMYFAQALIISNPKLAAPAGIPLDAMHPPKVLMPSDKEAASGQRESGR